MVGYQQKRLASEKNNMISQFITFIIPVFNSIDKIDILLNSLNSQSNKSFCCVFVDDCSTDNTFDYLKSNIPNFSYSASITKTDSNSGPGAARNIGMKKIETEYFGFIDSDDYLSDNYVQEIVDEIQRSDTDIIFSSAYKKYSNGKIVPHYSIDFISSILDDKFAIASLADIAPWGKIYKTSLIDVNADFFPTGIRAEDLSLIPVLYLKSNSFSCASKAVYYYCQFDNSRSRINGKSYNDIYKAFLLLRDRISYQDVIECRALVSIGYGVIMNAIRFGIGNRMILQYIDFLKNNYPNALHNKYFKFVTVPKRFFIFLAYKKRISFMRLLVKIAK